MLKNILWVVSIVSLTLSIFNFSQHHFLVGTMCLVAGLIGLFQSL